MSYYVGLDLGQMSDFTALSVVESFTPAVSGEQPLLHVRYLERVPLKTQYPDIVSKVQGLMMQLPEAVLCVDATGVGRPICDMFVKGTPYKPIAISITGGNQATTSGREWSVPKRDLVAAMTMAFQTNNLKIAQDLPFAKTLIEELLNFKVTVSLAGHDSYEALREGIHDDLVLSVAMAVYVARRQSRPSGVIIRGCTRRW